MLTAHVCGPQHTSLLHLPFWDFHFHTGMLGYVLQVSPSWRSPCSPLSMFLSYCQGLPGQSLIFSAAHCLPDPTTAGSAQTLRKSSHMACPRAPPEPSILFTHSAIISWPLVLARGCAHLVGMQHKDSKSLKELRPMIASPDKAQDWKAKRQRGCAQRGRGGIWGR